jgi:hypothetical protein
MSTAEYPSVTVGVSNEAKSSHPLDLSNPGKNKKDSENNQNLFISVKGKRPYGSTDAVKVN